MVSLKTTIRRQAHRIALLELLNSVAVSPPHFPRRDALWFWRE